MVQVKYKGSNYLLFGKNRIVNGINEIPDEEFYKLMKHPSFSSRITKGELGVPKDFPLEKPKALAKEDSKQENKSSENEEVKGHDEEDHHENDRLSVKQTLKLVQKSDDVEYLQNLIDSDSREKVKEAAQKRLEDLESEQNG
jgi:hypothetical protein